MADPITKALADWMPTGRVRRAVTPAKLVVEGAAAAAMAKARALRGGTLKDIVGDLAADERLAGAALRIATQLGEMKGAVMKLGQVLSFVDVGLVPEQYRAALAALQADAPPMPYPMVEEVVRAELGRSPDQIFDFFSKVPIAAASIGQVHMAHLGDRELVVKVQYPGVAKAVEADLRNAALLSLLARVVQRLLADLVGDVDVRAVIDEVRERVTEELDYRIEARNQQAFCDLYRDDPLVEIPAVVPELSTERVLTTAYVDGMRWSAALLAPRAQRDAWGQVITRFTEWSLLRHGLVNLDPHPGNYLFHEDGHVTFLDFGACRRFTDAQRARLRHVVFAGFSGEEDAMLASLVELGLLTDSKGINPEILLKPYRQTIEPMVGPQPFRFTKDFVAEQVAQALTLRFGRDEIRLLRKLNAPPEYSMIVRVSLGLQGILSQLEAAVDFHEIFDEMFAGDPDYQPFRPSGAAEPD